jgi:putative endonuclease
VDWHVYIILCSDDTLYTGITTDIARRMRQHADGRGAKYFRGRQPKELLYLEGGHDRSSASKRELAIKGLRRPEKQLLVSSQTNDAYLKVAQTIDVFASTS